MWLPARLTIVVAAAQNRDSCRPMTQAHTNSSPARVFRLWVVAALLLSGVPARAELGWSEADYAKHFGPALHSPTTADEAQFVVKGRGQVVVMFSQGHSTEEAWLIAGPPTFVPPDVLREARRMVRGTPVRRVDFRLPRAPAAQIFETRTKSGGLQVDYRNGAIVRIARCRGPQPCVLLDRFLAIDRNTDALMARTEAAMRREAH